MDGIPRLLQHPHNVKNIIWIKVIKSIILFKKAVPYLCFPTLYSSCCECKCVDLKQYYRQWSGMARSSMTDVACAM